LTPFNFYTGQLSVIKEAATYKLRVLLGDSVYSKAFLTYIIGVSKDSLIFAGIGKGQCEVPVAEKIFPEGIATFYLFDKNFNLLSKRRELTGGKNNVKIFYGKGIVKPSLFPVKNHGKKNSEAEEIDNRTTLFWNGSFLTSDNQHTTLGFYTSDIPATYKVTITGITINEDIIYKTLTFQSK